MANPYIDEGQRQRMAGSMPLSGPPQKPTALEDVGKTFSGNQGGYNPRPNELYYGGTPTGADEDVARGRQKAQEATQRGAYQSTLPMGALDLQRRAAEGTAPSRAEIAGRAALNQSLANNLSAAGASRGGPANVAAAQRNAAMGAAGQQQQATQQIAAERANEMTAARGQYGQTSLGTAGLQTQSEIAQRQLNQQGEQYYEGMGQHARDAELNSALDRQKMADERGARYREQSNKESEQNYNKSKDVVSSVVGAIGGLFSDVATKVIGPMGGLGSLGLGGTPSSGPAEAPGGGSPTSELQAHSNVATQFARSPGAMPMRSDEKAKERGVAGAPRGYAASRAGKPGSMAAPPASEETNAPKGEELAPGTADFARYGAPIDLHATTPEWSAAAKPAAAAADEGFLSKLGGVLRGVRSDERAKQVISKEEDFANANRSMAAEPYRYKSEFTPPDQTSGEINVGPMAQKMARSDVARTAIKREPETDLLTIDRDKGLKVVMGGLASLQRQVDAVASASAKKEKR